MLPIETLVNQVKSMTGPVVGPQPVQQQPVQQNQNSSSQGQPDMGEAAGEFVKALFNQFGESQQGPQTEGQSQESSFPSIPVPIESLRPAQNPHEGLNGMDLFRSRLAHANFNTEHPIYPLIQALLNGTGPGLRDSGRYRLNPATGQMESLNYEQGAQPGRYEFNPATGQMEPLGPAEPSQWDTPGDPRLAPALEPEGTSARDSGLLQILTRLFGGI